MTEAVSSNDRDPEIRRSEATSRLPWHVNALDLMTLLLLVLAALASTGGGFRFSIASVHVSLRSWPRLLALALTCWAVRHMLWRPTPLHARVMTWNRRSTLGLARLAVIVVFLLTIGQFYDSETGFTSLIIFGDRFYETSLPAVRDSPHYVYKNSSGYDSQFYAQLALVPLLRDRLIDRAVDTPPYRARRILFAWTAYVMGLGRTTWVLNAYALQGVVAWLVLTWVLLSWFPATTGRHGFLWVSCLFSSGLAGSVRMALLDAPSMLLIAVAVLAVERNRSRIGAAVLGLSGLGRETNLLAGGMLFEGRPRTREEWGRTVGYLAAVVLPLVCWALYVKSIYPTSPEPAPNNFAEPFLGYLSTARMTISEIATAGFWPARFKVVVLATLTTQVLFLACNRMWRDPWWRVGAGYALLMPFLGLIVWDGHSGAVMRVLLPMTFAFNVLLLETKSRWFWPLAIAGNLHVWNGIAVLEVPWIAHWL